MTRSIHPDNLSLVVLFLFFFSKTGTLEEEQGDRDRSSSSSSSFFSCFSSSAFFVGSLGIKYTQEILKKRRRQRLEGRSPTPFTDLLGYVLLAHPERKKKPSSSSLREGRREKEEEEEESLVSSSTVEVSTADVLPSSGGKRSSLASRGEGSQGTLTALYFTGSAVEEMLEVSSTNYRLMKKKEEEEKKRMRESEWKKLIRRPTSHHTSAAREVVQDRDALYT